MVTIMQSLDLKKESLPMLRYNFTIFKNNDDLVILRSDEWQKRNTGKQDSYWSIVFLDHQIEG